MSLLTSRLRVSLADVRSADPEEHILQGGRVGRVALVVAWPVLVPIRSSTGEFFVPASIVMPAMSTPSTSADVHHDRAVHGRQRGQAQAQHDRVRPLDLDRLVDVVHAGREEQVHAAGELVVDGLCLSRRAWRRRTPTAGSTVRASGRSPRRLPRSWWRVRDEDVVLARGVDVEVGLLTARRGLGQGRVRAAARTRGKHSCRGALHAGEHLVPDPVRPATDAAVAHDVLLLGAVDDDAGLGVGDEAAAGELRPSVQ